MSKVTTEGLVINSIFHRIVANLGSRDVDNRAFDEFYLSLRIAIELGHVLWLSNIKGNLSGLSVFLEISSLTRLTQGTHPRDRLVSQPHPV